MITTRRSRPLLGVLLGAATAQPAEARRAPAPCASPREPSLAAALSRDLAATLDGRESTVAVARDLLALLAAVSRRPRALALMGRVVASQAWGVTAGAPRTVGVRLENGRLPRATHGRRVHSVGIVRGTGSAAAATDFRMALLSHDNTSMGYGVDTLEGVALAVHRRLSGAAPARGRTPAAEISERPDGSAPYGRPSPPPPPPERGPAPGTGSAPGPLPALAAGRPSRTAAAPRRAPRPPRNRRSG